MKELIFKSRTEQDENIVKFSDIKDLVKDRVYKHEHFTGVKIDWLPFFNKKVKGFRNQELTVFSGPTGSGKTTFVSQLTLDLCKKDIPVLWGSFEIRNEVLMTNMLMQHSSVNLIQQKQKFDYWADSFATLPLYFLTFHGSTMYTKALAII